MLLDSFFRYLDSARQATRTRGSRRRAARRVPPRLLLEGLEGRALPSFVAPLSFDAGDRPQSVAVGEFNGAGRQDLMTTTFNHEVRVLLGNGYGTFGSARPFGAGSEPRFVAVEEFNGDGRPGLAVANTSGSVSVLLGNDDGSFQAARPSPAGSVPISLTVADVNSDGQLDLVVAGAGMVRVLRSNGDGTFQTSHISNVPGGYPASASVADYNSDGLLDVAMANHATNDVSILLNDGYWGGPAASFYVYPAGGAVPAGQPFDVSVLALNTSFAVVTNYTGQIGFYTTDPQATTPPCTSSGGPTGRCALPRWRDAADIGQTGAVRLRHRHVPGHRLRRLRRERYRASGSEAGATGRAVLSSFDLSALKAASGSQTAKAPPVSSPERDSQAETLATVRAADPNTRSAHTPPPILPLSRALTDRLFAKRDDDWSRDGLAGL